MVLAERNVADLIIIEHNAVPKTNITYATNNEVQMVDQFLSSERKRRVSYVDTVHLSTQLSDDSERCQPGLTLIRGVSNVENTLPDYCHEHQNESDTSESSIRQKQLEEAETKSRRSAREKNKREARLARTRVRYDMQLVPCIKRNKSFLSRYPIWWLGEEERRRHELRFVPTSNCSISADFQTCAAALPFEEDSSVLWIPSKRSEWEDSVNEMTAVCTSAAIRHYVLNYDGSARKKFHPPLSREYIKDRIDIDDPLEGYQIRHKNGGWLQGFILFTNFTTWTHDFKWDSRHPMSGIPTTDIRPNSKVDFDGSLADELEVQPRSGDPQATGIVFPTVAEIGLVGGLGCGEYLLRMALDRIRQKKQYKYVALQATDQSKSFYEEFGFVRVGSVCRYGKGLLPPDESAPITGYRHWTHANESERSLIMHGGPSYMMCLKLPDNYGEELSTVEVPSDPLFLAEMMKLIVEQKPRIEQLGATHTPAPKLNRRCSNVSTESCYAREYSPRGVRKIAAKNGPYLNRIPADLPSSNQTPLPFSSININLDHASCNESMIRISGKRSIAKNIEIGIPQKRQKVESKSPLETREPDGDCRPSNRRRDSGLPALIEKESLVPRSPEGKPVSSYVEKQYNSVWLAVPPKSLHVAPRPPPKPRCLGDNPKKPHPIEASAAESIAVPVPSPPLSPEVKGSIAKRVSTTLLALKKSKNARGRPKISKGKAKKAIKNSKKCSPDVKDRSYHCIRGSDGKFIRAIVDEDKDSPKHTAPPANKPPVSGKKHNLVNRTTLMKQKVKSYPRSRVHYYNRVVKPKDGQKLYYFVLNFDEHTEMLRLVPMYSRGVLSGKRAGRPRYQAQIGDTDYNFISVAAHDYDVVNAAMVMKTPVVASEAWDIEDD